MKTILYSFVSLLLVAGFSTSATAQSEPLNVTSAWAKQSIPGTVNGAAYVSLANQGETDVTLTSITTDSSKTAELHEHVHTDGMMKMQHVPKVTIAAGDELTMQPGGYHIMLFNLINPLQVGQSFKLTLQFSSGDSQTVEVLVRNR